MNPSWEWATCGAVETRQRLVPGLGSEHAQRGRAMILRCPLEAGVDEHWPWCSPFPSLLPAAKGPSIGLFQVREEHGRVREVLAL